jgi:tartrate/fumarate subfamily iron-sulfur-dependent hydro-lyase beta chain
VSEIDLTTPLSEDVVRRLRVGDLVAVTGVIVTARDRAHAYLAGADVRSELPFNLAGGVIYHCGPLARRTPGGLTVVSAGPTTSARMAAYEAAVVERYGVRAVIGKGGLPDDLLDSFARLGCVYLAAFGGCGALYARHIRRVLQVFKEAEFGGPEAFWVLEVERFPAIVSMDTHGGSLHGEVRERSREALRNLG